MRRQALTILNKYLINKEIRKHSFIVESVMLALAESLAPNQLEIWSTAAILHDLDYDITSYKICPKLHGLKTIEILKDENFGNEDIYSIIAAHNEETGVRAESLAQKALISANFISNSVYALITPQLKINSKSFNWDIVMKDIKNLYIDKIKLVENKDMEVNNFLNVAINSIKKMQDIQ